MSSFTLSRKSLLAIIFAIGIMVVVIVFIYIFISGSTICGTYRDVEYSGSYNNTDNTLLLQVKSWLNQTYIFNQVTIKDLRGQIVDTAIIVPTELPAYKSINITINLNSGILASGQSYRLELYTLKGDRFDSHLVIYEKVKTQVTLVNANTLSVDIQSLANQTIIFDKATINELGSYSVDTKFIPQIELLPNENITLTIHHENGFSYGNYSLILHGPSPPYVDGAWKFITVTAMEECFNQVASFEKITYDGSNNTLLVNVQSLSMENIVFTDATVKGLKGSYYAVIASGNPVPAEVPPYESVTITIRLKTHEGSYAREALSLETGNYILAVNCGANGVWATFTVP